MKRLGKFYVKNPDGEIVYEDIYENVCWDCHGPISSVVHEQCPICGWYICYCGACAPNCAGTPSRRKNWDSKQKRMEYVSRMKDLEQSQDQLRRSYNLRERQKKMALEQAQREEETRRKTAHLTMIKESMPVGSHVIFCDEERIVVDYGFLSDGKTEVVHLASLTGSEVKRVALPLAYDQEKLRPMKSVVISEKE